MERGSHESNPAGVDRDSAGGAANAQGGGASSPHGAHSGPGLIRALGRWDLTAVGVNQVIGSGIFVLPATVALLVGAPGSPWPYVAAGLANALIEVRQDLIDTHHGAADWAECLAPALEEVLRDPTLYRVEHY